MYAFRIREAFHKKQASEDSLNLLHTCEIMKESGNNYLKKRKMKSFMCMTQDFFGWKQDKKRHKKKGFWIHPLLPKKKPSFPDGFDCYFISFSFLASSMNFWISMRYSMVFPSSSS